MTFGHMGDGNLHYNLQAPVGVDANLFRAMHEAEINGIVYKHVARFNGSFSAEHGIGTLKRDLLVATQPAIATDLMRRIKAAFDPAGIMNPGKVI